MKVEEQQKTGNTFHVTDVWFCRSSASVLLSLAHPSTYLHELKRVIRISGVGIDLLLKHVAHVDKTRRESKRW